MYNKIKSIKPFVKVSFTKIIPLLILALCIPLAGCNNKSDNLVLSGSVESTQIEINAEAAGKIIKLEKEEGIIIKTGDVLATLDSSVYEFTVKQLEAVVKLKQAKLDELKAGTRSEQVKQAEAAVDSSKTAISASQTSIDSAQVNYNYWLDKYNKVKALSATGVSTDNELTDAQYKLDTASQQLQAAQKQYKASQSQLQAAQAQLELLRNGATNQTIKAAEADLEQAQALLAQSKVNLSKYQVKSPIDGTYLLRNANIGDMINTGTSIGKVSDLTDLWVKMYIPQRYIKSIALNQEISLKTISFPNKTIKGRITFIANEAEFTPKNTETSEAKENTVFKLKIKILDNIESLKPGMTVEASVPTGGK